MNEATAVAMQHGHTALEHLEAVRRERGCSEQDAFRALTEEQRASAALVLREQGLGPLPIGQRFGLSLRQSIDLCKATDTELGEAIIQRTNNQVVGWLVRAAERAIEELAKGNKWASYWKVHRELLQDLQGLGIVREVPKQVNLSHSVSHDQARAEEVERLVELERKRDSRKIEIEKSRTDVVDPLPMMGTVDVDHVLRNTA